MNVYKLTRFFLIPIILLADYLQTNYTKYFTPMNMGPVNEPIWKKTILKYLNSKNYVLDYGCGVGFFCRLFNSKKYIGLEINKNFIIRAKKINKNYIFFELQDKKISNYKNRVNAIFINNVLHHMSDNQVSRTLKFLKKNSKKNSKFLIIEPLLPQNFFSIQFFLKALDIGNFLRTKEGYLKNLKRVKILKVSQAKLGISNMIIIYGKF
jgi:SAM-dependent methyltransferase